MISWLTNFRKRSLATRSAALGLVVVVCYAAVGPVAILVGGTAGMGAAAAAAGFCLTGAMVALVASHLLSGPKYALYGMLAGMAARMGIPLSLGLVCHFHGGALAEAGLVYYLLVFYPVTLAVETALSLPIAEPSQSGSQNVAS